MKKISLTDFENYVKQFDEVVSFSKKMQASPEETIKLFLRIGETVLNRSKEIMIEEVENKLKPYLTENKEINLEAAFNDLFKFLKENNEAKK